MRRYYAVTMYTILTVLLLVGCDNTLYSRSDASVELGNALKKNDYKFVEFSTLQGEKWTKVCFLGPYNLQSSKTLGFKWDVTEHTEALASDGHNVIVFATDSEVISFIVHERGLGDFWQLTGQCYSRSKSKLYKGKESGAWHLGK